MKIGILWDLDGTLLDSLADLQDAVNYTLRHYGLPERTMEQIRRFVGNGAGELIRLALPGGEGDPPLQEAFAFFQAYYRTHANIKTCPYAGVIQALEVLGQRYPMAVVSNKPDAAVKLLCDEMFPHLYALGERPECPRKPAPDMVWKAMAELGVEKCVYVGDSEVDVRTGSNAGVPVLSVLWGFRDRQELEEAGGKYFCDDTAQLPAVIERIVEEVYGK